MSEKTSQRKPHDAAGAFKPHSARVVEYACSFCGRTQSEVDRLIAGSGPERAHICNICVAACAEVLDGDESALALPAHTFRMTAADDVDNARRTVRCSFCGKRWEQVRDMFAGPEGVHICDESVALCQEIIGGGSGATGRRHAMKAVSGRAAADAGGRRRHLLDVDDWTPDELRGLLERARRMREVAREPGRKLDALRGRVMVNLFYENSTRTRVSFELAGRRLGAEITNVAASASSVAKGESLIDTARTLQALGASIFVIRSSQAGAPDVLARNVAGTVVNAGDGWHAHPTQALLDLLTLADQLGDLSGRRVVILGDILHSRVARSNVWSLTALGAEVVLCGPPTLLPPAAARLYADRPVPGTGAARHVVVEPRIERALEGADAVMALRLQKERQQAGLLPSIREYTLRYGLTPERLRLAKRGALVLHPGPMNEGVEIDPAVAYSAAAVIEDQVTNGVAVRMAVLDLLCGEGAAHS